MLRLYLLRHAKSSWAEPGKRDIDRKLNARGEADLPNIAAMMRERKWQPSHVYCSDAVRTRATLAGIESGFDKRPTITFEPELYSGDAATYMGYLSGHGGTDPLMIVGHNPTCETLSMSLVKDGEPEALASLSSKYPTGGLAVFDLDIPSWDKLKPHCAILVDFVIPREL
ncbi:MAG: histidine phosphatase family protein [Nitratireductor sp.]